jgi:3-deoxy-alpha-D-manno-octulosonate 8-oxidase
VFDHLEEFYPEGVAIFKQMVAKNNIYIPKGICKDLTEEQFDTMIQVSLGMAPLWENALGKDWQSIMTKERLRAIYGLL